MKSVALQVILLLALAVGALLPMEGRCQQDLGVQLTADGITQDKSGASLEEVFAGIDESKVTKVVIKSGAVKSADWHWVAKERGKLVALEHFEVTEGVASVENIYDVEPTDPMYAYSNIPIFPANLKHVKIAKLNKIGRSAFINCKNLTTAIFPDVQYVDKYVFQGCSSLVTIEFPSLLDIQPSGFKNCVKLQHVSLPEVRYIWHEAFRNCVALETIEAPLAEKIGAMTFDFWSKKLKGPRANVLKKVHFPNVYMIEHKAFRGAALQEAVFPKLRYLGDLVFYECTSFSKLTLGPIAPVAGIGGSTMKQNFHKCPSVRHLTIVGEDGKPLTAAALKKAVRNYIGARQWI